jgi:putative aldouronate transport system substrate-binding protein
MGLSFPKTTEDLYATLKKIKAADPDSVPVPSRWGVGWCTAGFQLAYRTAERWLIDPDTNKLVYGPVTDNFRDMLKYINKLYEEKMLEQEFPTATSQQWREKYAQGKTYIQYSYINRAKWADDTMKEVDPDANWTWSRDNIIGYPDKEQLVSRFGYSLSSWGPAISMKCSEEKIDRLLEWFNWSCTEEGQIAESFGVEGVTFKYKDGKPVLMDHILSFNNPEGKKMVDYGYGDVSNGLLVIRADIEAQQHGAVISELNNEMRDKRYVEDQIAWELTRDQDKELTDLETVMNDIWKEYATKFIMGKLDPLNDAHWNEYLTTINRAALSQAMGIRQEAIKKSVVY